MSICRKDPRWKNIARAAIYHLSAACILGVHTCVCTSGVLCPFVHVKYAWCTDIHVSAYAVFIGGMHFSHLYTCTTFFGQWGTSHACIETNPYTTYHTHMHECGHTHTHTLNSTSILTPVSYEHKHAMFTHMWGQDMQKGGAAILIVWCQNSVWWSPYLWMPQLTFFEFHVAEFVLVKSCLFFLQQFNLHSQICSRK